MSRSTYGRWASLLSRCPVPTQKTFDCAPHGVSARAQYSLNAVWYLRRYLLRVLVCDVRHCARVWRCLTANSKAKKAHFWHNPCSLSQVVFSSREGGRKHELCC
eukprot:2473674-Rhodomonas_salina.2